LIQVRALAPLKDVMFVPVTQSLLFTIRVLFGQEYPKPRDAPSHIRRQTPLIYSADLSDTALMLMKHDAGTHTSSLTGGSVDHRNALHATFV
jgi:hypothetical protein